MRYVDRVYYRGVRKEWTPFRYPIDLWFTLPEQLIHDEPGYYKYSNTLDKYIKNINVTNEPDLFRNIPVDQHIGFLSRFGIKSGMRFDNGTDSFLKLFGSNDDEIKQNFIAAGYADEAGNCSLDWVGGLHTDLPHNSDYWRAEGYVNNTSWAQYSHNNPNPVPINFGRWKGYRTLRIHVRIGQYRTENSYNVEVKKYRKNNYYESNRGLANKEYPEEILKGLPVRPAAWIDPSSTSDYNDNVFDYEHIGKLKEEINKIRDQNSNLYRTLALENF